MSPYLKIAKELIAHQTDGFAARLVAAYEDLYKFHDGKSAEASDAFKRIVKLTKDRFGLNVALKVDTEHPPCCIPLLASLTHPLNVFINDEYTADPRLAFIKALRNKGTIKGGVDLKNAKVTGEFSRFEIPLYMSFDYIKQEFTPAQAAAVHLHEVGHCYYAFEFMFRSYRASQILAHLHQVKSGRDSSITYEHAITATAETLAGEGMIKSPQDMAVLTEVKDHVALCTVTYSLIMAKLATDFGSHRATSSNFEALADNFAVQFGLGAELAEGLAAGGFYGTADNGLASSLVYVINAVRPVALGGYLTAMVTVGAGVAITGAVAAAAVGSVAIILCLLAGGGNTEGTNIMTNVYKDPIRRLEQIREGIIGTLKRADIPNHTRREMLRQSDEIAKILKDRHSVTSLWGDVANFVFKERRQAKDALLLEANIEKLAHNEIFIGASALKLLA